MVALTHDGGQMIIEADDVELRVWVRLPGRDYRARDPGEPVAPDGFTYEELSISPGDFALVPTGATVLSIREVPGTELGD